MAVEQMLDSSLVANLWRAPTTIKAIMQIAVMFQMLSAILGEEQVVTPFSKMWSQRGEMLELFRFLPTATMGKFADQQAHQEILFV